MSNDTMPCGCEGHADNAHLCRYPALVQEADNYHRALSTAMDEVARLREQLAAERKRREDVEAEYDRETRRANAWKERAEQAEALDAERQAEFTRGEWVTTASLREAITRAERAEAERDEARDNHERAVAAYQQLERERLSLRAAFDDWKARAEAAEADNAALFEAFRSANDPHVRGCSGSPCVCGAIRVMDAQHPGAALLEYVRALETVRSRIRLSESGDFFVVANDIASACRAADALKERKP